MPWPCSLVLNSPSRITGPRRYWADGSAEKRAALRPFLSADTGHFALEDKLDEMVPLIRDFLGPSLK